MPCDVPGDIACEGLGAGWDVGAGRRLDIDLEDRLRRVLLLMRELLRPAVSLELSVRRRLGPLRAAGGFSFLDKAGERRRPPLSLRPGLLFAFLMASHT